MNGDVDPPLEQRLLELLDEDPPLADLAERPRPIAIAGGRHRHERELETRAAQPSDRQLRLGEREPTAAGADANQHGSGDVRA